MKSKEVSFIDEHGRKRYMSMVYVPTKAAEEKKVERECLKCDKVFSSKSKNNRVCRPCKVGSEWASVEYAATR